MRPSRPRNPRGHPLTLLLAAVVAVAGLAVPLPQPAEAAGPEPIRYAFDDAGRLVGVTDPGSDTAAYAYDPDGNLLGITRQPSSLVSVLSVNPAQGAPGTRLTVTGTGFAPTSGDNAVTIGGAAATVETASATQLTVTVPAGATTGPVAVTTPAGSAASTLPFAATAAASAPVVGGFSPAAGAVGSSVTISGGGFDPDPTRNTVLFNQAARGKVTAAIPTSLTVEVPAVGSGRIAVATAAGTATSTGEFATPPGAFSLADVESSSRIEVGGAAVTATINTPLRVTTLRFDGVKGQRLSFGFTGQTFDGALHAYVLQPTGVILSGNEFATPFLVFQDTDIELPPLPASGTYTVVVDAFEDPPVSGSGTGSVVATLSEDVDAGVLSTAGPGVAVTTTRPGQHARLAFDGVEGRRYAVALTGVTGSGFMGITVRWPDGEAQLDGAGFQGNGAAHLDPLPRSGRFEVLIDGGLIPRSFVVTLSEAVDFGAAGTTDPGIPVATSRPAQDAVLRFDGTAGQRLGLGLTANTYGAGTAVAVHQPDGAVLETVSVTSSVTAWQLPALPTSGSYEVVVSPPAANTGGATVTLSSELDGGSLTTTAPGTTSTIGRPGQSARLRFDGTAGQRLGLGFTGPWFAGTTASVLAPDGTALLPARFFPAAGGFALPVLPRTGAYEVLVDPSTARSGAATVTLSSELDGGSLTTTAPGTAITIARPGQDARLRFDGTAGQRLGLGLTGSTFGGVFRGSVLKPDGTALVAAQSLSGTAADLDLPALPVTGTYEVLVDPDAARTGAVNATLSAEADAGSMTTTGAGATVTVTRPGQDATVRFAGTAGERLSLGWTGAALGGSWFASVRRPDGATLVSPQLLSGTAADLDPPALPLTGTYEVLVDPQVARTGSVSVTLSADADAGPLTVGGAGVVAALARPGQNTRLRFDGTAGQRLTLALGSTTYTGFTAVSVLKPDGTALLSPRTMAGTAAVALAALPVAGTYTVLVDPTTGQSGSTTVTLTATPAAAAALPAEEGAATAPPRRTPRADGRRPDGQVAPDRTRPEATAAGTVAGGTIVGGVAGDAWTPDPANLRGMDWLARLPKPSGGEAPDRRAPRGVTALAGEVRTLDDRPLAGVAVSVGDVAGRTDGHGRFLLPRLPAGRQELLVDGRPTGRRDRDYGTYEIGVDLAAGRTTVLPYTIWLTRVDASHTVRFPSPATEEVVVTTPRIPGLEVHLPAGSRVTDHDGRTVRELGITAIPVDRPPFPLPENVIVPIYFTVQPGGAYVFPDGARIVYPNYTDLAPRTRVQFWSYDPGERGWHVYGHGRVTPDGEQVVPDPGVRVYEFTGAMINSPGLQAPGDGPSCDFVCWLSGDPVDLGTGLLVDTHTDLFLPDVVPISVTRTYRQADATIRPFGHGQNFDYGAFLVSADEYEEADLVLPHGGKIHFERISPGSGFHDAVFRNTDSPTEWYLSALTWNGNGWNLTRRDGTTWVFGDTEPLQAIRDRHGNQVTLTRTGEGGNPHNGPVTRITSPSGKWIRLSYDSTGTLVTRAEDSLGRTVTYAYDGDDRLVRVTDPAGEVTTYGWSFESRLATITDPGGVTFLTNEYDQAQRVTRQTLPEGAVFEFDYTVDTQTGRITQTTVTAPNGHVRKVAFNADGYATSDINAFGSDQEQTKTFARQPGTNLVTRMTDALGRETALAYDGSGNVTDLTVLAGTPDAVTTRTVYGGPFNQVTEEADGLGHTTRNAYDIDGELATVTDPEGRTVSFTHTDDGRIATISDHLSNTITYRYELGDLVSVTDPLGRVTRLASDPAGRVVARTDPAGATTRYDYDARNQVTGITDPLGHRTTFTYDDNGNQLTRTSPLEHTTTWTYDEADRVETRTDPLGDTTAFAYDPGGNLQTSTTAAGLVTDHDYDALDRLVRTRFGVTGAGQESSVDYTWDGGNRLTRIDDSAAGAIIQTPDPLDRITQRSTPRGTIGYTYDDAGRRTAMEVPGQPPVAYAYNDADQPTSIARGDQVVTLGYDGAGRLTTLDLPTGVTQAYGFDDAGQLTGITYKRGAATLGALTHTYDGAGRRVTAGGSYARTAVPDPLSGAAYNAADQLTAIGPVRYTYDDDGNLTGDGTTSYTWNARGQLDTLTRPGTTASFAYDALGRRTGRTVNGTTVGYLHDGDTPVQELDGTNTPTANLLTGGTDVYYARTGANGTDSLLTDALGSTIGLAGTTGPPATEYTYEPFGATQATGTADDNPFQFTGRENDGTGLYYYRARYYHPDLQRFISADPAGFDGGGNLYAYAANDPTNLVDPHGDTPAHLAAFVGGALVDGAVSYGMQRLSGRKVDWSQVAFDALLGGVVSGATLGLGKGFTLVDDVIDLCRINSFTPQTPVLMADGTTKPIARVREGDQVLATDPETGETGARTVTDVITGRGDKALTEVTVGGEAIVATDLHPFYVASRDAWVDAEDLRKGDELAGAAAGVPVDAVSRRLAPDQVVFNLTVEGPHTYYAGHLPVLVHNCAQKLIPGRPWRGRGAADDAFQHLEKHHGISRELASDRLHEIKFKTQMGAADDIAFGRTGDVYDDMTGEWLGSLTQGGAGRR